MDTNVNSGDSDRGRRPRLRETVSAGLLAIVAGRALVRAILGAVGASGWVIGLLVVGLTALLSAGLRRA